MIKCCLLPFDPKISTAYHVISYHIQQKKICPLCLKFETQTHLNIVHKSVSHLISYCYTAQIFAFYLRENTRLLYKEDESVNLLAAELFF